MRAGDDIQMCDIGDKFYRVGKYGIEVITITDVIDYSTHYVYKDEKHHSYFNHSLLKSCFKTYEEAQEEILRRDNIIKKRKLLKEYEKELNDLLDIEGHYIVK